MTDRQRCDLSRFYYTSLRRALCCLQWNEQLFAYALDEKSLDDRCLKYWDRFLVDLADTKDGELLFEKANLAEFRKSWLDGEFRVACLRRSKRFVEHLSILERVSLWMASIPQGPSFIEYDPEEIRLLQDFPESFLLFD